MRLQKRAGIKERVDMMVVELQEVYRVGVVLGIFEEDSTLQNHMVMVRKRFRAVARGEAQKGKGYMSSGDAEDEEDEDDSYSGVEWEAVLFFFYQYIYGY